LKLNKLKVLAIALVVALAFVFTACGGEQTESGGIQAGIVATVNGEQIKVSVLEHRLEITGKSMEAMGFPFEEDELRKMILEEMIEDALIRQAATDAGITLAREDVVARLDMFKELMGEEDFYAALEAAFLTEDDLKDMLEQEMIMEMLFEHVTRDVTAEGGMIARVSHILVEAREGIATPDERDVARAKAQDLITRLNAGESFAELAGRYSDCPSGANGGSMPQYFTESGIIVGGAGNFDTAFAGASHELSSIGDFTQEPVRSSFGYHIILLDNKEQADGEYIEMFADQMFYDIQLAVFNEYMMKIYEEADIVNYLAKEEN